MISSEILALARCTEWAPGWLETTDASQHSWTRATPFPEVAELRWQSLNASELTQALRLIERRKRSLQAWIDRVEGVRRAEVCVVTG